MIALYQNGHRTTWSTCKQTLLCSVLMASLGRAEVTTNTTLFCDNFSPTNSATPLSPWNAQSCNWNLLGGELECGPNNSFSYGRICLVTNWTDYAVQAQIKFSPNGYGGGLGGRLNATTGEHYAAWVYPRYDVGNAKLLRLVKFTSWTSWTLIAQTNVDLAGTNAHTLKLAFKGQQITVAFDGQEVVQATNNTLSSGGIAAEMWTDWNPYEFSVDELAVTSLVEATTNNSSLTLPATINTIAPLADGNMHLTITGNPGQTYHLQAINDLRGSDWSNISTNTADSAGTVEFDDLSATNHLSRFYRISTP